MVRQTLLSLMALMLLPTSGVAHAVFVVGDPGERIELRAQRAFIVIDEPTVTLHLQAAVRGEATSMLWLIPVDGEATFDVGERELLDAVAKVSEPSVTVRQGSSEATGCDDSPSPIEETVSPEAAFPGGSEGTFEGELLGASSTLAMTQWIEAQGFTPPAGFAEASAAYDGSGMRFIGVRVELDEAPTSTTALRPVRLTLNAPADRSLRFGAGLAMLSASASVPTQLYTLADQRFGVRNRASLTLDAMGVELADRLQSDELFRYDAAYEALNTTSSVALIESAGPVLGDLAAEELRESYSETAFYLTRIRTRVTRDSPSDLVIGFDNEAPEVPRALIVDGDGAPLLAIVIVALACVRRRRAPHAPTLESKNTRGR